MKITPPPLSLYIHLPWCIKKCPYCDFNSHALGSELPEQPYIDRLLEELKQHLHLITDREIISIFFGGGTPSLFSPKAIHRLLDEISNQLNLANDIEITMEANPGTVEQSRFHGYRQAGVNRLSLGIQSFNKAKLKQLGRIHDEQEAMKAIEVVKQSGFENFNIDIMHGLPDQTKEEALHDLTTAIAYAPTHISWYQLTIEPNTAFYQQPPQLPDENCLASIEECGFTLLKENGYQRYEVSAFSKEKKQCRHNLNYWQFGDYLGIGAGAHSKLTIDNRIFRMRNVKHPKKYLDKTMAMVFEKKEIVKNDLVFEFMLNALRLFDDIPFSLFEERTGIAIDDINKQLEKAVSLELLSLTDNAFKTTSTGKRFLNDLVNIFQMPL